MALEKAKETVKVKPTPKIGNEGFTLVALTEKTEVNNAVVINGIAYRAYPLENITQYTRCTVVGFTDRMVIKVKVIPYKTYA